MSASVAPTYIFTTPNCTTTIISLKPRAFNVELEHFILRFNKMTLRIPLKEGIRGERRPKDRVKTGLLCR